MAYVIQKLDQNWKTGCFNKRIIRLDDGDSFNEQECANITDLFTMDSKSVAVGCRSGLIKIFNRKDFSLQKVSFIASCHSHSFMIICLLMSWKDAF